MHRTLERRWVFLDGVDSFPAARERKRDGVSAYATEWVEYYRSVRWSRGSDVLCYFAIVGVASDVLTRT